MRTHPVKATGYSVLDKSGLFDYAASAAMFFAAPIPREEFVEPVSRVFGDAGQNVGQPSLRIDVVHFCRDIVLYIAAARCPPRSEPANSHDFLPRAIARSFCPCRARVGSPLPVAPVFWQQSRHTAGGATSDGPIS